MYGNLVKEMFLHGVTQVEFSVALGIRKETVARKMKGDTDFSSSEMFAIRDKFFPDLTLDYLFEKN